MYVTIVYVQVKTEHIEDFKKACEKNHLASVKEPGNKRFDILQQKEQPDQFILYEAYDSEASAARHKMTIHYLEWRTTVEDWMAAPRKGISYNGLLPD